ncbi:drug:proton antiporter [Longimycelium tulufanense]|uniref:Drug:proton antiporter n=1 Tax=Longimycelium tulufanense TaxID=907463 RepID=A0A8J3CCZ1_9PSEU|nr:geranylgeranyl reductase family protein [Longimycelium tulufanense]GGM49573.1 drug:proton antiporter [Longimycelium tulufanense]
MDISDQPRAPGSDEQADVIVVGAGPGGSTTAHHLARQGLDVLVLEKSAFPREKVCGDGLTPRAVTQLIRMGVDIDAPGWARQRGIRAIGGRVRLELAWPELAPYPGFGLTRTRFDLDDLLADRACAVGARLRTGVTVTGPLADPAGRVIGVTAEISTDNGKPTSTTFRAPLVVGADGVSGRLPLSLGLARRQNRPVGIALRRYYRRSGPPDEYLEVWLDVDLPGNGLLPGYGWIFDLGDGRVNAGLGVLNTPAVTNGLDYRRALSDWLSALPPDSALGTSAQPDSPVRGAALPMGFNRTPHYVPGLMLVGDCGGLVNPFSGEGIAYAMESGELAADIAAQALARPEGSARERVFSLYPRELRQRYGRYYRLGLWFLSSLRQDWFLRVYARHQLRYPPLARLAFRLAANMTDGRDGAPMDRFIHLLERVVPTA